MTSHASQTTTAHSPSAAGAYGFTKIGNVGEASSAGGAEQAVMEYVGDAFTYSQDRLLAVAGLGVVRNSGVGGFALEGVRSAGITHSTLTMESEADAGISYLAKVSDHSTMTMSLVKKGTGTWGLYGTNTLTGSLRVDEGTLLLDTPPPPPDPKYFRFVVKETQKTNVGGSDNNVRNLDRVKNWKLYINGERNEKKRICVGGNQISVAAVGMTFILR